jgi:hypothetical protein
MPPKLPMLPQSAALRLSKPRIITIITIAMRNMTMTWKKSSLSQAASSYETAAREQVT